jgi:hypothetical protein
MVEAPLYKIENIQQDSRIPFSGPGGRRFKSSLPDQSFSTTCTEQMARKREPLVTHQGVISAAQFIRTVY